jgi:hypothetical protein
VLKVIDIVSPGVWKIVSHAAITSVDETAMITAPITSAVKTAKMGRSKEENHPSRTKIPLNTSFQEEVLVVSLVLGVSFSSLKGTSSAACEVSWMDYIRINPA